jgi:serine/threonine-protein phosphatase PGAM5
VSGRWLYLVRHGEAHGEAEEGLTEHGRRQAELLGTRLAGVPFASVTHSPLPRAAETAAGLVRAADHAAAPTSAWPAVRPEASPIVGDYPPFLPASVPPAFAPFLEGWTDAELRDGPALAEQALARFAVPAEPGETHELVITHSFLIGWFVRAALAAPPERWMGLVMGNASLTVLRYTAGRPPALVLFNDMAHLPAELRWTGFPPHLRLTV